jgi:hypothetical protein
MLKKAIYIFSFLLLIIIPQLLFAQDDSPEQQADKAKEKKTAAVSDTIIEDIRYRKEINWFLAGGGFAYSKGWDSNLGFEYQFKVKNKYNLQIGAMHNKELHGFFPQSGDYSRIYNEIHIAIGKKIESKKILMATYAGLSYHNGGLNQFTDQRIGYYGAGIHADAQIIFKPVYDVGFGLNAFVNANFDNSFAGISLVAFFSNGFLNKTTEWYRKRALMQILEEERQKKKRDAKELKRLHKPHRWFFLKSEHVEQTLF